MCALLLNYNPDYAHERILLEIYANNNNIIARVAALSYVLRTRYKLESCLGDC